MANNKRYEAIESEFKATRAAQAATREEGVELTDTHLELVTELLAKAPRSTVIELGVTPEALDFINKAESVVTKLHELAFSQLQDNRMDALLLRVFRNLEHKIVELAHKVDSLEKGQQADPKKVLRVRREPKWTEDQILVLEETVKNTQDNRLGSEDFRQLSQQLGRSFNSVSSRYYQLYPTWKRTK